MNMMRILLRGALVLAIVMAYTVANAAQTTGNHVLRAVPATKAVTIDGSLAEWDLSGEIIICSNPDEPCYAVRVTAMYSEAGFFIAFHFSDATPMQNQIDPVKKPGQGWQDDMVQLRIWTEPEKPLGPPDGGRITHVDCYWYKDGKQPAAYVGFGSYGDGGKTEGKIPQAIGKGIDAAFRQDKDGMGYVQEMRLDWSLLRRDRQPYRAGTSFRMGIQAFWGRDGARPIGPLHLDDLTHPDAPAYDAFYKEHRAWGTVQLMPHGRLTPAASLELAPKIRALRPRLAKLQSRSQAEAAKTAKKPCLGNSQESRLVNQWYKEGSAAGNRNDWYDNRDRGHSSMALSRFPQMQQVVYSEKELKSRRDWALTLGTRPQVVIGNSSTSAGPTQGGSNPRSAYTTARGLAGLYRQYRRNNAYVYPEHRDHDPGHNGRGGFGDLYPTNTPYLVISQGSSGSDRVFLHAWAHALAALRPAVKAKLVKTGLLMPTLQMIFRMSNKPVQTPEDYLRGKAHPTVFEGKNIDPLRMVKLAHDLTPDNLPPMVQLTVLEEDKATAGKDYFDIGMSEVLANTPCVIARIHRRIAPDKRLVVSAAKSFDPNGKPLTYHWCVLRGDAARIAIRTRDQGATAEITIPFQPRRPIAPDAVMESNRVDIGVFVHNGTYYSAPGFVTVCSLNNEARTYDAQGRPLEIWYAAEDTRIGHAGLDEHGHLAMGRYDIKDWGALFAALDAPPQELPNQLLRNALGPDAVAQLRRTAPAFRQRQAAYEEKRQAIEPELKKATEAEKQARETLKQCEKTLHDAKAAQDRGPRLKNQAAFQAAKAEHEKTRTVARQARTKTRQITRELEQASRTVGTLLTEAEPEGTTPPKVLLERALNHIKNDTTLFVKHAKAILALVAGPQKKQPRSIVEQERDKLVAEGLLMRTDEGGYTIRSAISADGSLTRYETYRLRSFHLLLMKQILFPGIVSTSPSRQFVDRRLTRPKPWRDVYQYEADGRCKGWTRVEDNKTQHFTADGDLVLAADAKGVPTKTTPVDYVLTVEFRDRRSNNRLAGRVLFDGMSCSVYDADGKRLLDGAKQGQNVKPFQVQFLAFASDKKEDQGVRYVVDVNHYNANGRQIGWTRFDGPTVLEFKRDGKSGTFIGRDILGNKVPDARPKYQVPGHAGRLTAEPRAAVKGMP